jgi:hypothetical protein
MRIDAKNGAHPAGAGRPATTFRLLSILLLALAGSLLDWLGVALLFAVFPPRRTDRETDACPWNLAS